MGLSKINIKKNYIYSFFWYFVAIYYAYVLKLSNIVKKQFLTISKKINFSCGDPCLHRIDDNITLLFRWVFNGRINRNCFRHYYCLPLFFFFFYFHFLPLFIKYDIYLTWYIVIVGISIKSTNKTFIRTTICS